MTSSPVLHSRRAALTTGAGLAVAGTLLLPGCSSGDAGKAGFDAYVTANEDLMREHGVLRRILVVYRETAARLRAGAAGFDLGAVGDAAKLFQTFGEDYHEHGLEEQQIFPTVRNTGGEAATLVDPLLAQHERGRQITRFIQSSCASGKLAAGSGRVLARALEGFARMYEAHTAYEDTIVFPAWKNTMSKAQLDAAGDRFEDIERKTFGGNGFKMAVEQIAAIERRLGLHDLALFTAAAPKQAR
jgi:hemerythrin-like domain-containing protein